MKSSTYFKKNGVIYGISRKFDEVQYVRKFTNYQDAQDWLYTEEYDFRIRELVSRTVANKYGYCEENSIGLKF